MSKKWIAAAGIILSLGNVMVTSAEEAGIREASESQQPDLSDWTWQKDSYGWKYVNADGINKKNCWEEIGGFWYRFDSDGYIATDWTRVGGINYCFRETGELALGWCYNEEDETWYYYNDDGTVMKGWFQDNDGSWYWFSTKGEMASSGYKSISGKRYFFYDNGQLAANRYVGLFYMDENGQRDKEYDIKIEGKSSSLDPSSEVKDEFTQAVKNIPREWIKKFTEQGWEIIYYPDKEYFSAPLTGSGTYFVYHKLDTSYKKIKICKPEDLTFALGEYIGYASGCYSSGNQNATDLMMSKSAVEEFVNIPDYYADDIRFYCGRLIAAYVGSSATRAEMEAAAPEVTRILKEILYTKDK